jgi:hypothetical protein
MNSVILSPVPELLLTPLFAPTPKAAERVVEFFTAQNYQLRWQYNN